MAQVTAAHRAMNVVQTWGQAAQVIQNGPLTQILWNGNVWTQSKWQTGGLSGQWFVQSDGMAAGCPSVRPAMQGRGLGTALVRHAIEEARRLGCYKVILDCFEPLVGFYDRMGFRPFNRGLRLDLYPLL